MMHSKGKLHQRKKHEVQLILFFKLSSAEAFPHPSPKGLLFYMCWIVSCSHTVKLNEGVVNRLAQVLLKCK